MNSIKYLIMKNIFDKSNFGNLKLNSRIIRTGLWNTEKFNDLYKRYEKIASSGVGLIITEIMALHTKDKFSEYAFKIDHPNFVGECKQLAKISHKYNVPIFGQVEFVKYNRGIDLDIDINDLTIDDIRKIQTDLIIAAKKLSFADFDGIQLALGNNFYLSKFINPYFNQRDDEYGGNTYNRMKIVLETIKVIKNTTNLHVNCRINAFDRRKGGIDKKESLEISKLLEKYGADSIQVTRPLSPIYFTKENKENELLDFTKELVKTIDIPVILGGGFNDMEYMNNLLNTSDIGYLSMYRPFIAEKNFLKTWKRDGFGVSRCKMCNNCYRTKTSTCYHYE